MKKSSLLALSMVSLVALVGCGKSSGGAKKTATQKLLESVYSFFYEGEYSIKKSSKEFSMDVSGQGMFWDYENDDEERYYLLPDFKDSYIFLMPSVPLYAGETEGSYVAKFSDGEVPVPDKATGALYSTNVTLNTIFDDGTPLGDPDAWGYVNYWYTQVGAAMFASDLTDYDGEKGSAYFQFFTYVYDFEFEEGEEPLADEPIAVMMAEVCCYNPSEVFVPDAE